MRQTLPTSDSIISCAKGRNDSWGNEVLLHAQTESDLVSAEAKYHHGCALRFRSSRQTNEQSEKRRPPHFSRVEAFEKLCQYLEENDECQYSLKELAETMDCFLEGADGYEPKYLKEKLKQHYREQIIITNMKGRLENIVTFRDRGHKVLHDFWE